MPFVIVDDKDAGISGSAGTFFTGMRDEFQSTTTGVNTAGASIQYTFQGTSISVFGTLNGLSTTDIFFAIDGQNQSSFHISGSETEHVHSSVFNSSTSLSSGVDHVLNFTTNISNGTLSGFFFDYAIYDAPENSTITNTDTSWIFIDDTSPFLRYSSTEEWAQVSTTSFPAYDSDPEVNADLGSTGVALNDSITQATAPGATVSLNFFGSSVEVYGIVFQNSDFPTATYVIDNSTPINVTMPLSNASFPVYNWQFLSSPPLTEASHTLTLTAESADTFYLDSILVQSSKAFIPTPTTDVDTPPGSANSTSTASAVDPPPGNSSGRSSSSNAGAIVGGVVGAIAFIALVILSIIFFLRRRRGRKAPSQIDLEQSNKALNETGMHMARGNDNAIVGRMTPFLTISTNSQRPGSTPRYKEATSTTETVSHSVTTSFSTGGGESGGGESARVLLSAREEDSGVRNVGIGHAFSESDILPPEYTAD